VVGLSIDVSFGCSPICDRRLTAEQPLATQHSATNEPANATRLQQ
jgi:hypothetical protein